MSQLHCYQLYEAPVPSSTCTSPTPPAQLHVRQTSPTPHFPRLETSYHCNQFIMPLIHSLYLALMATAACANPVELNQHEVDRCAVILCPADTVCKTIDGRTSCIPINQVCGKVVCAQGFQCCNPSCGLCTKPGQACTMQACK